MVVRIAHALYRVQSNGSWSDMAPLEINGKTHNLVFDHFQAEPCANRHRRRLFRVEFDHFESIFLIECCFVQKILLNEH